MYWADELASTVDGPQVVNDSKTPSGTVHVGSLRGPVILDVIARALRDRGVSTTLLYGVDDMDPMDAQALLTPDAVEREMGRPLSRVADQVGDCHASYARHHAQIFIDIFDGLGIRPDRYYWMSDIYPSGALDPFIRTALDRAEVVRDLYRRISRVERPAGWLPISVVCPTCGKVGTTLARDWDGATVAFECLPDYVTWASGCGTIGRIAPFGGAAKLPWNLEWAAQWSLFGVTIEPCGKDLATAGGSRDRSDALAREVFDREPPRNLAYEFLNIGGRKMSTSKGRGAAAHEIAEVLPPEQLRLLFLRPRPNQVIEFDPDGTDAVPRVFDEFDRLAGAAAGREVKGELPADADRIFRYALLDPSADVAAEASRYRPAFAHLALLAQIPGVDVAGRVTAEKGSGAERRGAPHPGGAAGRGRGLAGFLRAGARPHRDPSRRAPGGGRGARRGPARLARRACPGGRGDAASVRRRVAGADLRGCRGGRAPGRPGLRCPLRRLPGPDERAARRLAAGQPGGGLRGGPPAGGGRLARSWPGGNDGAAGGRDTTEAVG